MTAEACDLASLLLCLQPWFGSGTEPLAKEELPNALQELAWSQTASSQGVGVFLPFATLHRVSLLLPRVLLKPA